MAPSPGVGYHGGMTIQHTSHARYDLWYHLAFATKYRKKVFTDRHTQERIKTVLGAIAVQYDLQIGAVECLSDHVHASVSAPPRIAPARIAQILKSVSTKML